MLTAFLCLKFKLCITYIQIFIFGIFKYNGRPYFEYLRFVVHLKDYPVTIQTTVFQIGIPLFHFFKNFDVFKSNVSYE